MIFLSRNNGKKALRLQSINVVPFLVGKEIDKQAESTDGKVMKNQAEQIPSSVTTYSPATNANIVQPEEKNTPVRHRHHQRNRKHQEENNSHNKIRHGHHTIKTRYGLWHRAPKWSRPFDTLASSIIGK